MEDRKDLLIVCLISVRLFKIVLLHAKGSSTLAQNDAKHSKNHESYSDCIFSHFGTGLDQTVSLKDYFITFMHGPHFKPVQSLYGKELLFIVASFSIFQFFPGWVFTKLRKKNLRIKLKSTLKLNLKVITIVRTHLHPKNDCKNGRKTFLG